MTAAPLERAALIFAAQSSTSDAIRSVHGVRGASGSIKISSARVRLLRSARGKTLSLLKSSGVTLTITHLHNPGTAGRDARSAAQQVINE